MSDHDNEEVLDEAVMKAFWLKHIETGDLYIVPRNSDSFDGKGPNDDILESLYKLSDEMLNDEDEMSDHGFEIIHDTIRRFDGYYYHA